MVVLRITVQPGARFPWHTHPGPVLVAVTQGDLVYVYGDDCVERTYPTGTALADPGSNVHFAFNPSGGETVLIATFLGVPATGPLTIPVDAGTSAALDAKCGVAPAALHTH
jgi:quercetin dioxygenase-like cupin family protein